MESTAKKNMWWVPMIVPILIIVIISICYQAMANYLSVYVLEYLHGSATVYGMIGMAWTFLAMVIRPSAGPLSQKFGSKAVMLVGLGIFAAMIGACGIFMTFAGFCVFRVLQCIGHGWSYTTANSLAAERIPKEHMGFASSMFVGIPQAAAIVLGPWLAVLLIGDTSNPNWFKFFVVIAAIMAAGLVLAAILVPGKKKMEAQTKVVATDKKAEEAAKYDENGKEYKGIWKVIEKSALPASVTMIIASFGHCTMFFLTAYVAATYGGVSAAIFFSTQALTEFLSRFYQGPLQDKFGCKPIIIPCCAICVGVYLCLANRMTNWAVLGLIYGIGQAGIKAPLNGCLLTRCPANRIPVATGTFQMANAIGLGFAALIAGVVIDFAGYSALWYYCAAIFVVVALLTVFVVKDKPAKSKTEKMAES